MDKLTVCLLSDAFPPIIDGVANAVLNYAENINEHWGDALVVTPAYPGADDSKWDFPVLRYPSLDVRKLTTGYPAGIPFSPELSVKLEQEQVNVLHAHCPMVSALMTRTIRKRIDAPTIMTYHTKYDIDIANVVKSKALRNTGIRSVVVNTSTFDEVWVVSEGAGRNLKSLGYQGDYVVMNNGVDLSRQEASEEMINEVTAGYDLPDKVPVFLFVGRLMWYKGFRITLDALKMLKNKNIDFRMVIVGSGGDEEEIREYVMESDLANKVIFTGAISDREKIRAWYTRADLFLFPSTFDSNGLVVREAAACNLAAVLIKDSCAAEDVTDNRNALLIEENAQSMAALLENAIKDMDHIRQLGINAGEELYLSWEEAVARATERYRIVQDLYRIGAFKEHDRFSDNLLATSGDLMYSIGQLNEKLIQGKIVTQDFWDNLDAGKKSRDKKR